MVTEINFNRFPAADPVLDGSADGIFAVDSELRITYINRAAEEILGVERSEAMGCRCRDVVKSSACEDFCGMERTLEIGRPVMMRGVTITNAKGTRLPVSVLTGPLRDRKGKVIGAVETFRDLSRVDIVESDEAGSPPVNLIGRSLAISRVFELVPVIAESDATVIVVGERGTGKDEVAQAIHELSSRRERPMEVVRCGSIPEELLEIELFGRDPVGSRPDSGRRRLSCFERAEGGTVFLNGIEAVPFVMQKRLLRVLNEKAISTDWDAEQRPMDARLITATDRDLARLVDEARFLRDLYYRVDVVRIAVPPLRHRRDDIPILADALIQRANDGGCRVERISPGVMRKLMSYRFPGNVRELQKIIESAAARCSRGVIKLEHLPYDLVNPEPEKPDSRNQVEELQRRLIIAALERHGYNRRAAAAELSVDPSTLWRRAKRLGIKLPKVDGRNRPRRN